MGDVGRRIQLEQVCCWLFAVAADEFMRTDAESEAGLVVIASALVEAGTEVGLDRAEGAEDDWTEDHGEQKASYQHLYIL